MPQKSSPRRSNHRPARQTARPARPNRTKVSFMLSKPLQKAVALYSADQSVQKSQVIEDALTEFFKTQGCDPNALPIFG